MSDLEAGKNLDNSTSQPLTGRKLWWRLFMVLGYQALFYYKDSAFPACPACSSPNVRLTGNGRSYLCLEQDCKSKGSCKVRGATASSGTRRKGGLSSSAWFAS